MTLTHTVAKDVAAVSLQETYVHSEHTPDGAWPMLVVTRSEDHTYGVWGLDETFPVLLFRALRAADAFRYVGKVRGSQPITFEDVAS